MKKKDQIALCNKKVLWKGELGVESENKVETEGEAK